MKTVKKGKEYKRVFDIVADHMVKNQGWAFCPKSEWREKVRDAEPVETKKKVKKNKKGFGKHKLVPIRTRSIKVDDAGVNLETGKYSG